MRKLHLFTKYKYKSVFFQIVLILATFSLFSIIIFLNFSLKLVTKTVQEKNNLMYVNVLNNAKNAVDYSLKGLHNIITHTSSERGIINAVVSPQAVDNSNDLEVLTSLSTLREETELISDVYLYIPKNKKVFTSRYQIVDHEEFNGKDILDSYYKNPNIGDTIEINGRITNIVLNDSKIYLVRDFPLQGERRLGTLIIKLDTDKLYNVLQGQGVNYANNLLVYDSTNNPIFPSKIYYSDAVNKYIENLSQKNESMKVVDKNHIFYTESPITQLRFLYVIDDTALLPSFNQVFNIVLPLGISILVICILLALFFTNRVYAPIKQLVLNVENASSNNSPSSSINEFDYLNGTFYNAINRYNNLDRVIKNILPDVSRKLFDDLLAGKPMETSYIDITLESINSRLDTKGIYNVMILKMEEQVTTDEMDLFLITVIRFLNENANDTCKYHIQMTEKAVLAVLFEFGKNMLELNIKLFELEIGQNILAKSKNLHLDVLLEKGKIYHSIQEVQFSYEEALEQLAKRTYPREESETLLIEAKIEEQPQPYYNKNYFSIRIKKIYDLLFDNDDAGALILAKQISKTIAESDNSMENIRFFYNTYIDAMLENMLSFNININSNIFLDRSEADDVFKTSNDSSELQQYVDKFSEQAISLASEYYKKQQHKYIILAKKYIESHYSDSNISLSSVADYVNTNTSYLSKLFKNNLNVNFNDYLNSYRIGKAKYLFDTTEMTLKEVAAATGFNSQQNFIRVFKKFEGVTPGKY